MTPGTAAVSPRDPDASRRGDGVVVVGDRACPQIDVFPVEVEELRTLEGRVPKQTNDGFVAGLKHLKCASPHARGELFDAGEFGWNRGRRCLLAARFRCRLVAGTQRGGAGDRERVEVVGSKLFVVEVAGPQS